MGLGGIFFLTTKSFFVLNRAKVINFAVICMQYSINETKTAVFNQIIAIA